VVNGHADVPSVATAVSGAAIPKRPAAEKLGYGTRSLDHMTDIWERIHYATLSPVVARERGEASPTAAIIDSPRGVKRQEKRGSALIGTGTMRAKATTRRCWLLRSRARSGQILCTTHWLASTPSVSADFTMIAMERSSHGDNVGSFPF